MSQWELGVCFFNIHLSLLPQIKNHHVPPPSGEHVKAVLSPGRKNTIRGEDLRNSTSSPPHQEPRARVRDWQSLWQWYRNINRTQSRPQPSLNMGWLAIGSSLPGLQQLGSFSRSRGLARVAQNSPPPNQRYLQGSHLLLWNKRLEF